MSKIIEALKKILTAKYKEYSILSRNQRVPIEKIERKRKEIAILEEQIKELGG